MMSLYDAETGQIQVPAALAGFTVTVAGAEIRFVESDEKRSRDGWRP